MANELKSVDSMPGSINEFIMTNKRLKRPPSLSDSFAFTPENIARANRIPLIPSSERLDVLPEEIEASYPKLWKYEQQIVEVAVKLLFHITLISIFETLFYFLYVSSLENNGIEKTVNTFINGATEGCKNMTNVEIQLVDDLLEPYINSTAIIISGNDVESSRIIYNTMIMNRSWFYVAGLSGLFIVLLGYIRLRKIKILWLSMSLENVAMVILLALYELMFFNTIIYQYEPVSTEEIGRNAIEKLQDSCGILE
jgi:hypothetical protein